MQDNSGDVVPFQSKTTVEADRVILAVVSDIDIASVAAFQAALDNAVASASGKPIAVDLSRCTYLDSTGISALVVAYNAKIPLTVIASRHVAKLLDIVGLSTLLGVTAAAE